MLLNSSKLVFSITTTIPDNDFKSASDISDLTGHYMMIRNESEYREIFKMYTLRSHFFLLNHQVSCASSHQDLSYCKISQAFLHLRPNTLIFSYRFRISILSNYILSVAVYPNPLSSFMV